MSGFYTGKRVIVTGGAGFLGQHVVKLLQEAGAAVFVPRSTTCDLRYPLNAIRMVLEAQQGHGVDIIFHLAAHVSGIANTAATPADHLYDNATMALNVIHAAHLFGGIKLVMAGSVCAYPERVPVPTLEDHLWNGKPEPTNASYGAAKRLALSALEAYHQQHGLKCAYLLSANLYGPGDDFNPQTSHVIPALIRKVAEAQRNGDAGIAVWGSGSVTRDFLYVEDAARAYLQAGELVDIPTPINIASGQEVYIGWLVENIKALMGFQGETAFDRSKPDGQTRRCWRIDRAKELLGWTPAVGLDEGLRRTVEWYRSHHAGDKA